MRQTKAKPSGPKTPVFDALIMEAQRTRPDDLIDAEELAARYGITDEEREAAAARLDAMDAEDADSEAERASPNGTAH